MVEQKMYIPTEVEFIELGTDIFTLASCENRWADTGEVAVSDGTLIYCDCTSYENYNYTYKTPKYVGP